MHTKKQKTISLLLRLVCITLLAAGAASFNLLTHRWYGSVEPQVQKTGVGQAPHQPQPSPRLPSAQLPVPPGISNPPIGHPDGPRQSPPALPTTAAASPPPSSLVQFADDSAKQVFLTRNSLQISDLQKIPLTNTYQLAKKPDSLALTPGAETHPNQRYQAMLTPNDPRYPQWFSARTGQETMWSLTTGSSSVTMAIIDTGFALNHQDLANRWAINPGEYGGGKDTNNLDDDHNGLVDDWRGWDFARNDNDPAAGTTNPTGQAVGHATAVTGIAAATGNNSLGLAGNDWSAKVLPIQVLDDDGDGFTSDVISALAYARSRGVDVVNLSLGAVADDPLVRAAIDATLNQGIVVVAAAGNDGCDCMVYPARYPNVVAVGASDTNDERAYFSSYGPELDVLAPGYGPAQSTLWAQANPTSLYTSSVSGTSIAAPFVSSLATMFKAAYPSATASQIVSSLRRGAEKLPAMNGQDFTPQHGYGRVNAYATVRLASITHPDGTLVINPANGTVYLLADGAKRRILSPEVFLSYYRDIAAQSKTATLADIALPDGPALDFRSGTLVKGGGPDLFVLSYNGSTLQRQHVPSVQVQLSLGYDIPWLGLPDSLLNSLPQGPALTVTGRHPNSTLVRQTGYPAIFLIENNQRRYVPSVPVLQSIDKGKFNILPATASDLALPQAADVPLQEGAVVKGDGNPLYVIDHVGATVQKRQVASPLIHNLLGFTEAERLRVGDGQLPNSNGAGIQ